MHESTLSVLSRPLTSQIADLVRSNKNQADKRHRAAIFYQFKITTISNSLCQQIMYHHLRVRLKNYITETCKNASAGIVHSLERFALSLPSTIKVILAKTRTFHILYYCKLFFDSQALGQVTASSKLLYSYHFQSKTS